MLEEYQMIIKLVKVDQFGNKAVISFQNKTIEKLPIHNIVVNTKGRIHTGMHCFSGVTYTPDKMVTNNYYFFIIFVWGRKLTYYTQNQV